MARFIMVDEQHLRTFIQPINTFSGWSIAWSDGTGTIILRVENPTLYDYVKRFKPPWATVLPPLCAGIERLPAAMRLLMKAGTNARTVRDFLADLVGDDDFE